MATFISSSADGQKRVDEQKCRNNISPARVLAPRTFAVLLYVGGESSLVSHVCSVLAILLLDDASQRLVELSPHPQGLMEGLSPDGQHHELLHSQPVTGMGASVDHVKSLSEHADKVDEFTFSFAV